MQDFRSLSPVSRRAFTLTASSVAALLLTVIASTTSFGQGEVVPSQIKDLNMGSSSSQVIDKIASAGTYSKEVDPRDQRMKLTWLPPDSAYYQNLEFRFTEKGRLYIIRFSLRQEVRQELPHLRNAFFEKFRISPENPMKLRVKGQDVLIYAPEQGDLSFFEFTDVKTGERSFELFKKDISAQDKPSRLEEDNKENKADSDKK